MNESWTGTKHEEPNEALETATACLSNCDNAPHSAALRPSLSGLCISFSFLPPLASPSILNKHPTFPKSHYLGWASLHYNWPWAVQILALSLPQPRSCYQATIFLPPATASNLFFGRMVYATSARSPHLQLPWVVLPPRCKRLRRHYNSSSAKSS
jgi:hypothetical protein